MTLAVLQMPGDWLLYILSRRHVLIVTSLSHRTHPSSMVGGKKRQTSRLCLPEDILSQAEAGGWLIFGSGKTETGWLPPEGQPDLPIWRAHDEGDNLGIPVI